MFENLQKIEIKVMFSKSKRSGDPAKCTAFVAGEQGARGKENAPAISGHGLKSVAIQFAWLWEPGFCANLVCSTEDWRLPTEDC